MIPDISSIDFEKSNGLVPVIVQDAQSYQVLMLAYMNAEAYRVTLESGLMTFYSRSRNALWQKGETSGNVLHVESVELDCDRDTLLFRVRPEGPACHRGSTSCFGDGGRREAYFLQELENCIAARRLAPAHESYTRRLFEQGLAAIAQKVGEEATEVIIAALAQDPEALREEVCDLLYHLLVLLNEKELSLAAIERTLKERNRKLSSQPER